MGLRRGGGNRTYTVEVDPGEDVALILALTLALTVVEQMCQE